MGKHLSPSSSEIALPRRAERLKKCPVIRVKLSGSSTVGFANDLGDAEQALDPKQLAGAIGRLGPPNPRRRCCSRWQSTLSAPDRRTFAGWRRFSLASFVWLTQPVLNCVKRRAVVPRPECRIWRRILRLVPATEIKP